MSNVKKKLLAEVQVLPEHRLAEVLDYIYFLQYQENRAILPIAVTEVANHATPLQQFIGGVEHGALAQDVDEDLY